MILGAFDGGGTVLLIVIGLLLVVRIGIGTVRSRRRQGPRPDDAEASARATPPLPEAATLRRDRRDQHRAASASDVLYVDDLVVAYGSKRAVEGLSFEIGQGEIFGLLGPNGAGKTSTLSAIEGLVRPQAGTVLVDGIEVERHPTEARAKLGVQLQATSFQSELTIAQIVRLYAGLYGLALSDEEIGAGLQSIGLGSHASREFKQLSGGQQQRLSLYIALIHGPVLLLLDEPTTGLDPQARRQFWSRIEHIRDGGGSILLTTHSMEEAQAVCDRVAIVDHGRLLATGAPRALVEEHRDDPLVREAAHGDVTLEDVFIGLTGGEIRD